MDRLLPILIPCSTAETGLPTTLAALAPAVRRVAAESNVVCPIVLCANGPAESSQEEAVRNFAASNPEIAITYLWIAKRNKIAALQNLCRHVSPSHPDWVVFMDADILWFDDTLSQLIAMARTMTPPFAVGANIMHGRGTESWSTADSVATVFDKAIFLGFGEPPSGLGVFMRYCPGGTYLTTYESASRFFCDLPHYIGHDDVSYSMHLGQSGIRVCPLSRVRHEWPTSLRAWMRMRARHIGETTLLRRWQVTTEGAAMLHGRDVEDFTATRTWCYARQLLSRRHLQGRPRVPVFYTMWHFVVLGLLLLPVIVALKLQAARYVARKCRSPDAGWQVDREGTGATA